MLREERGCMVKKSAGDRWHTRSRNRSQLVSKRILTLGRLKQYEITFYAMLPNIQRSMALFGGSQASLVCPSDKSSINMKMSMELWWYNSNRNTQSTHRQPV
jgi:hypothetical protein